MDTVVACTVLWSEPLADRDELRDLLDDVELDRYRSYRDDSDRHRFLTGRVLAKSAFAERLEIPAFEIILDATCSECGKPHGKPRVATRTGGPQPLELSIAHSGDRVGVAVTSGFPVGLDVEQAGHRTIRRVDGLIEYALTEDERSTLAPLPPAERERAFLRYWTRKEALMKATGRGLRVPLGDLTVSAPWERAELIASHEPALTPKTARMIDLEPLPDHPASLAVLTGGTVDVAERPWQP